jgi:hypothetical protein
MSVEADKIDYEDGNEDLAKLRNAAAQLMEHFDTVQIFVTRHVDYETGTIAAQFGDGNWYARRGQIGNWIVKQDADAAE